MSTKDFKRIFIYGVSFVIYQSCVLCQVSNPIPQPHFELMKPKGFRITLADPKIPNLVHLFAGGSVYNETKDRVEAFGGLFRQNGDQFVYENNPIAIEPGYITQYTIWVQDVDKGYHLREEPYQFVAPATFQHSQTSPNVPVYPDVSVNPDVPVNPVNAVIAPDSPAMVPSVPVNSNTPNETPRPPVKCDWSETIVQGRNVCQGELIFQDDFDFLNTSIWSRDIRIPLDIDDADFVLYRDYAENLNVTNGKLFITPKLLVDFPGFDEARMRRGEVNLGSRCTGIVNRENECKRQAEGFRTLPPVVSARINTKKSFSFRYGKIEIRAQMPKGDWMFPLLVLDPLTSNYGISGYASGQMRVAFIRGNEDLKTKEGWPIDGSYLSGGVVLKSGEKDRDRWLRTLRGRGHWGNAFHTYSLTWTRSEISLAYDGNIYAILSGFNHESGREIAPFDEEFYISLGVSAGGISDFPDGSISSGVNKPWENSSPKAELHFWNARNEWFPTWDASTASLAVDYVKVWAL